MTRIVLIVYVNETKTKRNNEKLSFQAEKVANMSRRLLSSNAIFLHFLNHMLFLLTPKGALTAVLCSIAVTFITLGSKEQR